MSDYMNGASSATSPIESWTVPEVSNFLASIDLDQYDDAFAENEITGDILVRLEHESLKDIGVESVGHRLQILRAVYDFKVKEAVPLEPGDWEPASFDGDGEAGVSTNAELSKDMAIITQVIQQRDERIAALEEELRRVSDSYLKLRDQLTPVFKIVKEFQPLPTPEMQSAPPSAISAASSLANTPGSAPLGVAKSSLSRKYSTKKLFLGGTPRQPSPTSAIGNYSYTAYDPDSPDSPNRSGSIHQAGNTSAGIGPNLFDPAYAGNISSRGPPPRPPPPSQGPFGISSAPLPTPSRAMSPGQSDLLPSITTAQLPHPPNTALPYLGQTGASPTIPQSQSMSHSPSGGAGGSSAGGAKSSPGTALTANSNSAGASAGGNNSSSSGSSAIDAFKSFRVGLDDPCSKVLPAALKKYRIQADWHDYALFICHGETERCLALHEKPLLVFQDLQRAGKNPVFMLRKQESLHANAGAGASVASAASVASNNGSGMGSLANGGSLGSAAGRDRDGSLSSVRDASTSTTGTLPSTGGGSAGGVGGGGAGHRSSMILPAGSLSPFASFAGTSSSTAHASGGNSIAGGATERAGRSGHVHSLSHHHLQTNHHSNLGGGRDKYGERSDRDRDRDRDRGDRDRSDRERDRDRSDRDRDRSDRDRDRSDRDRDRSDRDRDRERDREREHHHSSSMSAMNLGSGLGSAPSLSLNLPTSIGGLGLGSNTGAGGGGAIGSSNGVGLSVAGGGSGAGSGSPTVGGSSTVI